MSEENPDMKAQGQGTTQRASRIRIAVALCTAGLVTGTLGSNLVGAGADNPPPPAVPGEVVAAAPTQVPADEEQGVGKCVVRGANCGLRNGAPEHRQSEHPGVGQ